MSTFKSTFLISLISIFLIAACSSDDEVVLPVDNDPEDMPADTMTMIDTPMDTMTMDTMTMTDGMGMDTMTMGGDGMGNGMGDGSGMGNGMGMDTMTMDTMTMTDGMGVDTTSMTIWTGEELSFVLADDSDITAPGNQDTITSNVIITRASGGGQIFNLAIEAMSDENISPAGTAWAVGRTDDLENLTFTPFREAVGRPRDAVGVDLVLHLVEDNIFLNVTFTDWSVGRNNGGGFAYRRATPNQ